MLIPGDGFLPQFLGGLVGGGTVGAVAYLALVERLRSTFATKEEVNGVGSKYNALESLYLSTRELAESVAARCGTIEATQREQWLRIAESVIKPLDEIASDLRGLRDGLSAQAAIQAAHGATLEAINSRLDRAERGRSGP